jgi:hypothetical protein
MTGHKRPTCCGEQMRTMSIAGGTKKGERRHRRVVGYICVSCKKTYMALGWQPGGPVFQIPVPAPASLVTYDRPKKSTQSSLEATP